MSNCLIGWDRELEGYLFQCKHWITLSPSLVEKGHQQHIFEKDGEYALPPENSYLFPFARQNGWQLVVSFPSHHEILEGPEIRATQRFLMEFDDWWRKEIEKGLEDE